MTVFSRRGFFATLTMALVPVSAALADDPVKFDITIKDHKFTPTEIRLKAGQRAELTVINADATPEEFESKALKVEKVIAGGRRVVVKIGPLKPGSYAFVGEYHEDTAKGVVIVE